MQTACIKCGTEIVLTKDYDKAVEDAAPYLKSQETAIVTGEIYVTCPICNEKWTVTFPIASEEATQKMFEELMVPLRELCRKKQNDSF